MNADYKFDSDAIIDDALPLDGAENESVQATKSTLVAKRDIQLPGGFRGVEFEMIPQRTLAWTSAWSAPSGFGRGSTS